MNLFNHILGGLYGQALGDAWAMPALLRPEDTWNRFNGWITAFYPAPDDHPVHHGLPAGRVTDDTEQAFALAESILAEGGVSPQGAANAIIAWYDRVGGDACPYVGPSTRRAVQAFKRGVDLNKSGLMGDTNGAAMRISPVGLIHPGDVEGAVRDAYAACIPTHNTDVAASGAGAIAGAIAAALAPGASLEEVIAAGIRAAGLGRKLGPVWIGASVSRRISIAVEIARGPGGDYERLLELYDVVGSTLAISESVPASIGVLAMAQGEPVQAAIFAAGLSGDADTVGAMACAVAGAWKGAAAFPPEICARLTEANPELDFQATAAGLTRLAERNLG